MGRLCFASIWKEVLSIELRSTPLYESFMQQATGSCCCSSVPTHFDLLSNEKIHTVAIWVVSHTAWDNNSIGDLITSSCNLDQSFLLPSTILTWPLLTYFKRKRLERHARSLECKPTPPVILSSQQRFCAIFFFSAASLLDNSFGCSVNQWDLLVIAFRGLVSQILPKNPIKSTLRTWGSWRLTRQLKRAPPDPCWQSSQGVGKVQASLHWTTTISTVLLVFQQHV